MSIYLTLAVSLASRGCLIVSDTIVAAVTWYMLPRRYKSRISVSGGMLADVLVRNGMPGPFTNFLSKNLQLEYRCRLFCVSFFLMAGCV